MWGLKVLGAFVYILGVMGKFIGWVGWKGRGTHELNDGSLGGFLLFTLASCT